MAIIEGKDWKGRKVRLVVHPMRGAILTLVIQRGQRTETIEVALTPQDCRMLEADFREGVKL